MKFVYKTDTLEGANEIKELLENAGIPVSITNKRFAQLNIRPFPYQLGVFIYLDSQYNDAISLLNNKNHVVKSPVNCQEFYRKLENKDHKKSAFNAMNTFLLGMIVFGLLCGLLIYALQ